MSARRRSSPPKCLLVRTMGERTVVAGQNTHVIAQRLDALEECIQKLVIHAEVQIHEVQEHEPVKRIRQVRQSHLVMADLNGKGIAPSSLMQAQQPETTSDQGWVREPVLTIEKLGSLAQGLSFVLRFSPETLYDVGVARARFECGKSHLVVRCEIKVTLRVRNEGPCHAKSGSVMRKAA